MVRRTHVSGGTEIRSAYKCNIKIVRVQINLCYGGAVMPKSTETGQAAQGALVGFELHHSPGHLLRRWQQRAVDIYLQEVGDKGPRPRQFAVLMTVSQYPGLSQTELVARTGIDRSTIADMLERLSRRGLVRRRRSDRDHRTNVLEITKSGQALFEGAIAAVERAQIRILEPIPCGDQAQFMACLSRILDVEEEPAVAGADG